MISFGNAASSHSGLIPLKTAYKKEGNCSGRSRVRRILLTCIQMLLIQFLEVIWSTPKNFAFFQKPLDKFFIKSTISRSIVIYTCTFSKKIEYASKRNRVKRLVIYYNIRATLCESFCDVITQVR